MALQLEAVGGDAGDGWSHPAYNDKDIRERELTRIHICRSCTGDSVVYCHVLTVNSGDSKFLFKVVTEAPEKGARQ